jgi:hypothetical protein
MRFLILQDKQCPGWAYEQTKEVAEQHGHSFVKWEAHLQVGKHFDGVLMFPRPAYCLDYTCDGTLSDHDDDDEDISVEIGRGIYEESIRKRPNTYVVCYNTDEDENSAKKSIQLLQGWETERGDSSSDYNEWGKLWFKEVRSSRIHVAFKAIAKGLQPDGAPGPTASGIIGDVRRLLLLLINR